MFLEYRERIFNTNHIVSIVPRVSKKELYLDFNFVNEKYNFSLKYEKEFQLASAYNAFADVVEALRKE